MRTIRSLRPHGLLVLALLLVAPAAAPLGADGAPAAPAAVHAAGAPTAPTTFPSREAALEALRAAMAANDDAAIVALVGSASADLVQDGKDAGVAKERKRIVDLIKEKVAWEEIADGALVLALGFKAWPVPIPLASKEGQVYWDGPAGRDELLARRIGGHELAVIEALRAVVEAQEAYKAADRDGDGVLEYAQRFVSTEGQRDGLWWPEPADLTSDERSPLGAMLEDYLPHTTAGQRGAPFEGYYFRLLTEQGACTPGGPMGYLQGANLVAGWAVIAYPAEYFNTGVKSFIISHRGRLFERDLGPKGDETAKALKQFNPDSTWVRLGNP